MNAPAIRRVSIVALAPVGGLPGAGGPRSGKRPYDPRHLRTPGIPPVRQAHRVAREASGFYVEPRLVVGGLLAVALLSTKMVVGVTSAPAAPIARSIETNVAQLSAALSSRSFAVADHVTGASIDSDAGELNSAPLVLAPMVAAPGIGAAPSPTVAPATPRPKATPRPTAVTVKKLAAPATTAPKPRPAPTPKPAPAIVYQHKATGNATWGYFGGAVITRLPPGTQIRVCGSLGCWEGVSSGYGPSAGGGNLVDLDAAVFQRIGGPLGTGVRSIVLSWR